MSPSDKGQSVPTRDWKHKIVVVQFLLINDLFKFNSISNTLRPFSYGQKLNAMLIFIFVEEYYNFIKCLLLILLPSNKETAMLKFTSPIIKMKQNVKENQQRIMKCKMGLKRLKTFMR